MLVKKEEIIAYNDHSKNMLKISSKSMIERIKEKKQGVYYFGFPECPWCVELLPVLDESLSDAHVKAYVFNVHDKSFSSSLKKELTSFYKMYLHEDKIYVPLVIAINKKHEIKVHLDTVKGHNAKVSRMTKSQSKELRHLLDEMILFSKK